MGEISWSKEVRNPSALIEGPKPHPKWARRVTSEGPSEKLFAPTCLLSSLIQRRIRERLSIRVYELVLLEFFIGSSWDQIGQLLGPKLGKHSQACSRQEQNDSGDNQKLASV